jgi:hypothetical protein
VERRATRSIVLSRAARESETIDSPATGRRVTATSFSVWMQRGLIINRYLFAGLNVAQRIELHPTIVAFHVSVGTATMVDVVCPIAATAAIYAPTIVHSADAQHAPPLAPAPGFRVGDSLARVVRDFLSPRKERGRKAALTVDGRFPDGQAMSELHP